jgi:hypothetical protein
VIHLASGFGPPREIAFGVLAIPKSVPKSR